MSSPPLYEEWEVLKRLKIQRRELSDLLDVGLLAPAARSAGQPMYCVETIDLLSTRGQRSRLADALWWDFDLQRPRYVPSHLPWAPPPDSPLYPFDDEKLRGWVRRMYKLKKDCAPFPYPHRGRLERFRTRMEDRTTRAFEKAHGIKRPRKSKRLCFRGGVKLTRADLRDLVWSKTMIRAAADLGISEFTLRKICKIAVIPAPTRGHFNHKRPKDRPSKPALSSPLTSGERAENR